MMMISNEGYIPLLIFDWNGGMRIIPPSYDIDIDPIGQPQNMRIVCF